MRVRLGSAKNDVVVEGKLHGGPRDVNYAIQVIYNDGPQTVDPSPVASDNEWHELVAFESTSPDIYVRYWVNGEMNPTIPTRIEPPYNEGTGYFSIEVWFGNSEIGTEVVCKVFYKPV